MDTPSVFAHHPCPRTSIPRTRLTTLDPAASSTSLIVARIDALYSIRCLIADAEGHV